MVQLLASQGFITKIRCCRPRRIGPTLERVGPLLRSSLSPKWLTFVERPQQQRIAYDLQLESGVRLHIPDQLWGQVQPAVLTGFECWHSQSPKKVGEIGKRSVFALNTIVTSASKDSKCRSQSGLEWGQRPGVKGRGNGRNPPAVPRSDPASCVTFAPAALYPYEPAPPMPPVPSRSMPPFVPPQPTIFPAVEKGQVWNEPSTVR